MQTQQTGGIVCEYNPFHNGHQWMINQMRAQGVQTVVCVISASFVQRAQPAFYPTHIRAAAALAAGADLVLRLPLPYSSMAAGGFALAGVGLLAALGCVNTVFFGAETANTQALAKTAALLNSPAINTCIKNQLATGLSFAGARAKAAEELMPGAGEILASPNNILGVEYCAALMHTLPGLFAKQGFANHPLPQPQALARKGAQHDGPPSAGFASASWLRNATQQNGAAALRGFVPNACLQIYLQAEAAGQRINPEKWQFAQLARLKGVQAGSLCGFASGGDGLALRLARAVQQGGSMQQVFALAKTKRFAHSRIRRLALEACLNLPKAPPPLPPFVHMLGANQRGLALLKQLKAGCLLPFSSSLAKLMQTSQGAKTIIQQEAAAQALYCLCQQQPQNPAGIFTQPPIICL